VAPDLAPNSDPPPVPLGRIVYLFLRMAVVAAALMLAFWAVIGWMKAHHAGTGALMAAAAVYCAIVFGLVLLRSRSPSICALMTPSDAARRLRKRMMIAAAAYMIALLIALDAKVQFNASGVVAYVLALLVAAPVIGMIAARALYLREEPDEVERAIQVESTMWAIAGVMAFATAWGFLELFTSVPQVQLWTLFPVLAVLTAIANVAVRRRYR
jgi:hypothetical protein